MNDANVDHKNNKKSAGSLIDFLSILVCSNMPEQQLKRLKFEKPLITKDFRVINQVSTKHSDDSVDMRIDLSDNDLSLSVAYECCEEEKLVAVPKACI